MKLLPFLLIPLFLAGCNDKIYDESYYSAHLDEAAKVIEQCTAGKVTNDNCQNAKSAIYKIERTKIMNDMLRH